MAGQKNWEVDYNTTFTFTVEYKDPDGTSRTFYAGAYQGKIPFGSHEYLVVTDQYPDPFEKCPDSELEEEEDYVRSIKRTLLWVAAAVAMGFAQANEVKNPPQATHSATPTSEPESRISWQTFQATPLAQANIAANQVRIVFLRQGKTQETATPADIYINGRFHSAVLPGAYAEAFVCAGDHQIEIKSRATAGIDPAKAPSLKIQVKSK
jgi:hypothetical protein